MTTILALSDTHLNNGNLPPKIVELAKFADLVLHAGNFTSQAAYNALKNACKGELWAVYGGLDPKNPNGSSALKDSTGNPLKKEVFEEWNKKIWIYLANDPCEFDVFSEPKLMLKAEEMGADLLVFGNINQPIIVWGKWGGPNGEFTDAELAPETSRLLVCPGSSSVTSIHNSSFPSVVLLDIIGDKISGIELVRVIDFQDKWRYCGKCRGLYFGPNAEESKCPAGGTHISNGSRYYTLIQSPSNGPQPVNWRRCEKCQGLFDASGGKGVCPDGGTKKEPHIMTGSGNYEVEWG